MFLLLCLTYFTQYDSLGPSIVAGNGIISFVLKSEKCFIVHMYHIFIHPVSGRLGCFHVLAIVNGAVIDSVAHVSFQILFSLDICPEVGLQARVVAALFLVF